MTHGRGDFRVSRAVFDHPEFADEPFDKRSAWLWLISEAAWSARTVNRAGKIIKLERSQLAHSFRFLGEKWDWDYKRAGRFLGKLAALDMIRMQTKGGISIITITNYELYQNTNAPGQQWDKLPDENGTNSGTVNGTDDNCKSADDATVSKIESSGSGTNSGTVNGTDLFESVSEKWDKPYKHTQKKESKTPSNREIGLAFDEWWQAYPKKADKKHARGSYERIVTRGEASIAELLAGAKAYAESVAGKDPKYTKYPATWLNKGSWADELPFAQPSSAPAPFTDDFWRDGVRQFLATRTWSVVGRGPRPGEPGCRVPAHILEEFNIRPP